MDEAQLSLKRAYEPAAESDGTRVLVDRLWPRGLDKQHAAIDEWLKELAPSAELRKWFGHEPERWEEFRRRYAAELTNNEAVARLRELAGRRHVTLVYAAHDEAHNNAVALRDYLLDGRHE